MEIIRNNPYLLGVVVLCILNLFFGIFIFWQLRTYRLKQQKLLAGEGTENLTEIVLKQKQLLSSHSKNLRDVGKILGELIEQNQFHLQKVGFLRFNPFANTGGDISFTLALLDGKNNGIVISSLHGREGTRIYAKSVENGQSKYNLTDEEKEAIICANQRANIKK